MACRKKLYIDQTLSKSSANKAKNAPQKNSTEEIIEK